MPHTHKRTEEQRMTAHAKSYHEHQASLNFKPENTLLPQGKILGSNGAPSALFLSVILV